MLWIILLDLHGLHFPPNLLHFLPWKLQLFQYQLHQELDFGHYYDLCHIRHCCHLLAFPECTVSLFLAAPLLPSFNSRLLLPSFNSPLLPSFYSLLHSSSLLLPSFYSLLLSSSSLLLPSSYLPLPFFSLLL